MSFTSVLSFCQPFTTSILEEKQNPNALRPQSPALTSFLGILMGLVLVTYPLWKWRKQSLRSFLLLFCGSDEQPQEEKGGQSPKFPAFGITFAHCLLINLTFHFPFSQNFKGFSSFTGLIIFSCDCFSRLLQIYRLVPIYNSCLTSYWLCHWLSLWI